MEGLPSSRQCLDLHTTQSSTSCSCYRHHQKRSASRVFKGRRDNSCRVPRHKPRHARTQHTLHMHPPFAPALLHAASVHSSVLWHGAAYCLRTSCALWQYHGRMLAGSESDTSDSNIFHTCTACAIPCGNSVRVCFVGGSEKRSSADFCQLIKILYIIALSTGWMCSACWQYARRVISDIFEGGRVRTLFVRMNRRATVIDTNDCSLFALTYTRESNTETF
jgi:hypothetical protein